MLRPWPRLQLRNEPPGRSTSRSARNSATLRINDSKALVAAGRLVRIPPDYEAPSRPMHILFAAERRPTPKLRRFIELAEAQFGPIG